MNYISDMTNAFKLYELYKSYELYKLYELRMQVI